MGGETEGLGLVLIEAMASGVPVIGSNTGGIPDIIDDRVNGLLVPPGDVNALAEAITTILSDHLFAVKLCESGAETIQERFSWKKISTQFTDIYKNVETDETLHSRK